MTRKATKAEVQEARERLLSWLKPGDTVTVVLRHVSRSGMIRRISAYHLYTDERGHVQKRELDYHVSLLLNGREDDGRGVVMGGCGMDMGFALVYGLSARLWPDGFECIGERCPSNDHSNGDRDYSPHMHREGAYALWHEWL